MVLFLAMFHAHSGSKVDQFNDMIDNIFSWVENLGNDLYTLEWDGVRKKNDYAIREKNYREELQKILVQMQTLLKT